MRISRFSEEARRKIYTFTFSRKEEYALRQIWLYLETVYPNINATDSATLSDLNDGYEAEAEVESPGTPDTNDEDFNDQNYLEDDEMDETETAAAAASKCPQWALPPRPAMPKTTDPEMIGWEFRYNLKTYVVEEKHASKRGNTSWIWHHGFQCHHRGPFLLPLKA
jgi:hypothetical protein